LALESCDENSSFYDESAARIKEAANPFKASATGAGLLSMIQKSITSLHLGFKCGKEKGKVFAGSGATVVQDFNLKMNTLSSDGDGDWGEKME